MAAADVFAGGVMADEFMQLQGFKELAAALREMPEKIAEKVLRSAVASGASEVKKEVVRRAPTLSGALKVNVFFKRERTETSQRQVYIVGVKRGQAKYAKTKKNVRLGRAGKTYNNDGGTFYWKFAEFGTSRQPAKPFVRPAFESQKNKAIERIRERLDAGIQKIARDGKK